jgi:hypothetical protein
VLFEAAGFVHQFLVIFSMVEGVPVLLEQEKK